MRTKNVVATILLTIIATPPVVAQKSIYIPTDLQQHDLTCDTARWCWRNSVQTDNLVFFWEQGFGHDIALAPDLDGHSMVVDMDNLKDRMEYFYHYFRDTLAFIQEGSVADTFKMLVMINYSLEGTAYGGTYDDHIGALWVAPNRIQDKKLNCLAHELGHSFQTQIIADKVGDAWGGGGFYEMTSQWMLWRVNPDWVTEENYHFEAFKQNTHKAFLHIENIYRSPYIIEYWAEKHGLTSIAELYRQGLIGEDPVMTYKRAYEMTQEVFLNEMFEACRHLVCFDFNYAREQTQRYAFTFSTPLDTLSSGWMRPKDCAPEQYGFNVIPLPCKEKTKIRIQGKHLRYGFAGLTTDGNIVYSPSFKAEIGHISIKPPKGKSWKNLCLVVMGAPEKHQRMSEDDTKVEQFPYSFKIEQ